MTRFRHIVGVVTNTKQLITTAQAAKLMRVTPVTVHRWIRSGQLEATKLPGETGAYVIDPAALDRFAASRGAA